MISDELKNKIKDALRIEDVIGEFISLKKKGINYVGYCPFHQDKHPSFMVNPGKQIWRCFVDDIGGDIFAFIQEHEKLSFPEAVRWCARRANIEFEDKELSPEEVKRSKEKEALRIAITAASDLYCAHLSEAKEYLLKRGFDLNDDLLKEFRVGYAPEGNVLYKGLTKAGYLQEYLTRVNVIGKGNYDSYYDIFRDRLMFPYFDLSGNIIGFSGRIIKPKDGVGKYVNTGETELFTKGKAVFGLYQARKKIAELDNVYLVEGQMDVLSMHAAKITNTVAAGGTALTPEHIKMILRFTHNVTLVYDGDKAGQKAALAKCKVLLQNGANVRCISLPEGKDPDDLAREQKENTAIWLTNHTEDFVTYFEKLLNISPDDPIKVEEAFTTIASLVAEVKSESLQNSYLRNLAKLFAGNDISIARKKVRTIKQELPSENIAEMKSGIYGLDELTRVLKGSNAICVITSDFSDYLNDYGTNPVVYIKGIPSKKDIQELRCICSVFTTYAADLYVDSSGNETTYLSALAELYKGGLTDIKVLIEESYPDDDEEEQLSTPTREFNFLTYYIKKYNDYFLKEFPADRSAYVEKCADLISYASESARIVNSKTFALYLDLTQKQYNDILKPFLEKRKSRLAMSAQRSDVNFDYDPNTTPDYVDNSPEYSQMYQDYGYYPLINKDDEPVGYMFKNDKGSGHSLIGDFYMTPLLHVNDPDPENNKRILKINRRYYGTPLFIEVPSKALLKKSTIEEVLINLEAVNFSNGEERHWTKIKEYMSRNYVTCTEVKTYGNQQKDGFSRKEDENFFAFSNGIFHFVDGVPTFSMADDLGVVTHNEKNYYLPAFSKINGGRNRDDDKYETVRTLVYNEIPPEKQCSFEHWAELMDKVYSINDNGKWAIIYAVMCAFRSNIHSIDRLFTALFFMGPMMSGKTQIAISIRSLFISPKVPIFNLNTGTYAALSSLMSTFRDVPVVLDEYNNKDIQDVTFQLLKGIVYDGDGRQKRKGTSGKEIESEKVYAPVILSGQETPQRDDNALMSRVIVREVPKPTIERTEEQKLLFQELKDIENPDKVGLSNVLFEVLKLRPVVMDQFKVIQRQVVKDLTKKLPTGGGDMVRIINTVSLFLTMCKIIEDHSPLTLPFTYDSFFEIAAKTVISQVELISHTDKIATFFKAMDVMINTGTLKFGRDFTIDAPGRLTLKISTSERQEYIVPDNAKVLYLRVSNIYTLFARSSYNPEQTTQSTIEQNLRSNPAYIGVVNSKRFQWFETVEVPKGGLDDKSNDNNVILDDTMVRKAIKSEQNTSCWALNYDIFRRFYDIDLERSVKDDNKESNEDGKPKETPLPF